MATDSPLFLIEKNHYQNLLTMEMLYLSRGESIANIKKEGLKQDIFIKIADMLLSYEFFDRELLVSAGQDDLVSKSLELAGGYVDALLEYEAEGGGLSEELAAGSLENFLFSAVLAKYAGDIEPVDRNAAKTARRAAERAYQAAEKIFATETLKSQELMDEMKAARYWAAAELYKSTGDKGCRKAAEEEALQCAEVDPLAEKPSVSEEQCLTLCFDDFGSIAYLTTTYRVDRDVSDTLMAALIGRAIETAEGWNESRYALSTLETGVLIERTLENARLLTFANLVSQSTLYVEAAERAVESLYGMNGERRNYIAEEAYREAAQLFILDGLANSYVAAN